MTIIRRRIATSGHGTPIPVRIEDAKTGQIAALVTASQDGRYEATVTGGRYRVSERWGRSFQIAVPESGGPFDIGSLAGETPSTGVMAGEAPEDSPEVARRVGEASTPPAAGHAESDRPPRVPRSGDRGDTDRHGSATGERPPRVPRDGARERAEGPWTRVRRGERSPRDGGRRSAATREFSP